MWRASAARAAESAAAAQASVTSATKPVAMPTKRFRRTGNRRRARARTRQGAPTAASAASVPVGSSMMRTVEPGDHRVGDAARPDEELAVHAHPAGDQQAQRLATDRSRGRTPRRAARAQARFFLRTQAPGHRAADQPAQQHAPLRRRQVDQRTRDRAAGERDHAVAGARLAGEDEHEVQRSDEHQSLAHQRRQRFGEHVADRGGRRGRPPSW